MSKNVTDNTTRGNKSHELDRYYKRFVILSLRVVTTIERRINIQDKLAEKLITLVKLFTLEIVS